MVMIITSAALGISPGSADEWSDITGEASGQKVYWYAWGGAQTYNDYIEWVGERVFEEHNIEIIHVKLGDTAEAVRKVLAEKTAGRLSNGTVDLIWINGENFKTMKEEDLLYGPFVDKLPNFKLVDTEQNPGAIQDFTILTEGLESPWGMAKLIFIYDQATLKSPPRSIQSILDYARTHPGRISYPAPPDFSATTFLKQALLELTAAPEELQKPARDNFDRVTEPLWLYLDALVPHLWKQGEEYPENSDKLIEMLGAGDVDLAYSFQIGGVSNAIEEGILPDSARSFVLDQGTIGNTHFVAIPFNSAHKEAAMVVANFLMSPEAQARKQNPLYWGEQSVLASHLLSDADKKYFDDIPRGIATLSHEELGRTLPEPHPSWITQIEEVWLRRYSN
ncbi:ABC transporter substrate-binding protein [Kiloniella sp.]|uniref:ABC transporter substrate-binding protein n=1 Tax=Kiloniella sp. TaxID=1938587 RepID=UPI003B015D48